MGVHVSINGVDIVRVSSCKFLGIIIDDKLKWSEHITHLQSKISKSLYALNRSKRLVPQKYLKTIYDTLVHSHISYGITLWGSTFKSYLNKIQILQKKAVRFIMHHTIATHSHYLKKVDYYILKVCMNMRSGNLCLMHTNRL